MYKCRRATTLRALLCLGVMTFTSMHSMPSRGADDLLEEVRAGNKSSLESIRTLFCRVTKSSPTAMRVRLPTTVEYWWAAGSSRVVLPAGERFSESVIYDLTMKTLSRRPTTSGQQQDHVLIVPVEPDQPNSEFDPWGCGLLKLWGPKGCPLTLDEILKRPHKLRGGVERETADGRESMVVNLSMELQPDVFGDFRIWFDPQTNYLARKLTLNLSGSASKLPARESEVLRFVEVAPAVYFPEHVETRFHKDGQLTHHDVVTFSEIRVNAPLPPNIFEFAIPPGATVLDKIQDKEYSVDAKGNPVGPGRPLAKVAPLPLGAVAAATTHEPQPLTHWILPASVVALLVTGGFWFFLKWRSQAAAR